MSGPFTYKVIDGKATITDCDRSVSGDLTIPSTIKRYPVAGIGTYAFRNCKALTAQPCPPVLQASEPETLPPVPV